MFPDDVAELFDAYYPDAADRQQFSQDLARLGAEEVARDYEVTLGLLEGYVVAAEILGQAGYMVFADARERTRRAHLIAKGARNEHGDVHEIMDETAPATAKRSLREVQHQPHPRPGGPRGRAEGGLRWRSRGGPL
jgi:hypothetical protein